MDDRSDPGAHELCPCWACGELVHVRRLSEEPTGWAHAMAIHARKGRPRRADPFACPHAAAAWHRQATALREEAARTASPTLTALLTAEADEVVRTRAATK